MVNCREENYCLSNADIVLVQDADSKAACIEVVPTFGYDPDKQ